MWSNSELVLVIAKKYIEYFIFYFLNHKKEIFGKKIRQLICINCVGVLINNPPPIEFSYKFEFILRKTWEINSFAVELKK